MPFCKVVFWLYPFVFFSTTTHHRHCRNVFRASVGVHESVIIDYKTHDASLKYHSSFRPPVAPATSAAASPATPAASTLPEEPEEGETEAKASVKATPGSTAFQASATESSATARDASAVAGDGGGEALLA